jgi:hypothetical protein
MQYHTRISEKYFFYIGYKNLGRYLQYLESLNCDWKIMEMIIWTDRVRNEEVLHRVK